MSPPSSPSLSFPFAVFLRVVAAVSFLAAMVTFAVSLSRNSHAALQTGYLLLVSALAFFTDRWHIKVQWPEDKGRHYEAVRKMGLGLLYVPAAVFVLGAFELYWPALISGLAGFVVGSAYIAWWRYTRRMRVPLYRKASYTPKPPYRQ